MEHHFLFVQEEHPTNPALGVLLGGASTCHRRVGWDAFDPVMLAGPTVDLVILVFDGDLERAIRVVETLGRDRPTVPVLAVLPVEPNEGLTELVLGVADDVVFPPIRPVELRHRVARLLAEPQRELEAVRQRLLAEVGLTNLVGTSPAFQRAVVLLPRFARADVSVLIGGETGTGKEVCARALHHLGRRRDAPFVVVDCGAIPEPLFENELFGHLRGAFTGADRDHKGQVACAEGGTLLLDEIDALSLSCQAKLLRFLQERTYRPLGSDRVHHADVRVLAATNRDLQASVRERAFRSDLYFRLSVLHVDLPPLRDRRGDVELLACSFLQDCSRWMEAPPRGFSPAALRALSRHEWPGNVRELGNVVQRAAVTSDGEQILPCHLELSSTPSASPSAGGGEFRAARAAAVAAFERRYVEDLLRRHQGNVTRAAREARQDRRAFGRLIKKHQVDRQQL
jgi:DNA-binding NtrC family response regulator